MRLIDADALRKELRKKNLPISGADVYYVRKLIDSAPTIEPQIEYIAGYECGYSEGIEYQKKQRPQGKWIYENLDYSTCSNCYQANHYGDLPFCPNCGAKMTKGEVENECKNNT